MRDGGDLQNRRRPQWGKNAQTLGGSRPYQRPSSHFPAEVPLYNEEIKESLAIARVHDRHCDPR